MATAWPRGSERIRVVWAFLQGFFLLSSLYLLRPLRDEMGVEGGVKQLQWLFTGTFLAILLVVPVYGWAVGRFGRRALVPAVNLALAVMMVAAYVVWQSSTVDTRVHLAQAIFVWISVFNILAVSVFWSLMADVFKPEEGRRLFGLIAAGGSCGALVGPLATAAAVQFFDPIALLPMAAGTLTAAALCVPGLLSATPDELAGNDTPATGGILSGFKLVLGSPDLRGIAGYMLLMTWISTIFYFEQADILGRELSDRAQRTALFAGMDFAVNISTLALQALLTGAAIRRLGLGGVLAVMPLVSVVALTALAIAPILTVFVVAQVARRTSNFAMSRVGREVLYTGVPREAKYKAKNVLDTVVYRGGDAAAGWLYAGLAWLGLGLGMIALVGVPFAAAWARLGVWLGRRAA